MSNEITSEDLKIIASLRRNARSSLVGISQLTQMPQSTVYDKVKTYEQSFIKKHTCLIDYKQLGYNVEVKIAMKAKKESKDQLLQYLKNHANVNSAFHINNDYDFFVEGIFRNYGEMYRFVQEVQDQFGLEKSELFHILHDIKHEEFLSN